MTPPEQLRELLVGMKRRGLQFEHAWRVALERIVWPWNNESRRDWKTVIASQEALWRSCYNDEGEPIDVDRLLQTITHELDFEDPDAEHFAAA